MDKSKKKINYLWIIIVILLTTIIIIWVIYFCHKNNFLSNWNLFNSNNIQHNLNHTQKVTNSIKIKENKELDKKIRKELDQKIKKANKPEPYQKGEFIPDNFK